MRAVIVLVTACFVVLETAVVFRRVCSYCRDKEVYKHGHNYVGFYQKHNTGPLEGFPCAKDRGNLMKCSTSCIQAQLIEQETGKIYTYRDCGTYLLQEFGSEKFNLSYTQYAMILSDVDDEGNTWVFKFCNKEKCLHPSDYEITEGEYREKGTTKTSRKFLIVSCSVAVGIILGLAAARLLKAYNKRRSRRNFPPVANVELLRDNEHEPEARISIPQQQQ
ncbi:hypothetical protein GCK32_004445 [Trichostrongylus colubriformis]|uniref:Uncharacterized protein n=1 Tax=Trichostrongylus colubriformis TaxID=6319 RepID=A0AAN8FCW5_TRICO